MNQLQPRYVVLIKALVSAPDASEATEQVLSHGVPLDSDFEVLSVEQNDRPEPDI